MRAVVRRGTVLQLDQNIADPVPGKGQILVRSLACGICGSDLHALHHLDHMAQMAQRSGASTPIDPGCDMIFGHEFCGEIVDYGPGCNRSLKTGTRVVSIPYAAGPASMELVGYSNRFPGGFGEFMVLEEALAIAVPDGVGADHAALTEPLAVGLHAVNKARIDPRSAALVIGCGPVGLAVIGALKRLGIGPIVASDFSAERRAVAERLGADILIDPAVESPHGHWGTLGVAATLADSAVAAATGRETRPAVVFECVGAPGIIQSLIELAPPGSKLVIVGVCMAVDQFEPAIAINKEMSIDFAFGYSAQEFAETLRCISDGKASTDLFLTGSVGLEGVAGMFGKLSNDPSLVKVMVKP